MSSSQEIDPSQSQNGKLHICPQCTSKLVQPERWSQAENRGHWKLWRRCPECEWRDVSVFGEKAIDAYDEVLDEGTIQLNGALKRIERENMTEMADSFTTALERDLIVADDFGPRGA